MLTNQRGKSRFDLNAIRPFRYPVPVVEPIHFWSKAPNSEISAARKQTIIKIVVITVMMWVLLFLVACIFIGGGHQVPYNTKHFHVIIIDYDQQQAGTVLVQSFQNSPPRELTLHWIFTSPSNYNPNYPIYEVTHGKVWAAVSIKPGTTQLINSAIDSVFSNTIAMSAISVPPTVDIFFQSGRSFATMFQFIVPPILAAIGRANGQYSQILETRLIQQLNAMSSSSSSLRVSSSILNLSAVSSNPILFTLNDLAPIKHNVGQAASTIGYIFVYLLALISVASAIGISKSLSGKIRIFDIVVGRLLSGAFQGLIVSLIYALIVLWFYGYPNYGQFVRYWMFNWLFFLTFTPIVALLFITLGPLSIFILTLFFILTLSTADLLVNPELQPRFFRVGYGLPFYHVMAGARHLLFGSYSNFKADVGCLIGWSFFTTFLAAAADTYYLHKAQKKIRQNLIKEKQTKK
ncbi:unnamed protein product [Didymodactylos carnosus]|uniref:DUF3533 domain-containing protein n=1 Tax=Didymodactylos carnosus TaxID=1234261 RepID=A0A814PQ09_9BILA|nr:unnamed protein product [Didymodactylos carnosus]CAF1108902.1 unnamed protein product [Didymodactylos carnosus]CAF3836614.1 unnamed protein product [Didymodactylos carnosus]CAF3873460.1 unnamed protein product [Didymodactylos carnosus]